MVVCVSTEKSRAVGKSCTLLMQGCQCSSSSSARSQSPWLYAMTNQTTAKVVQLTMNAAPNMATLYLTDKGSGGFRGGWASRPPPPFGRRTDAVTHGIPTHMWQPYCIMATPSPVYLFEHVKHDTQNIPNDRHQWHSDSFRVHQIRFRPGLRPAHRRGGLQRFPTPYNWFKGPYF